MDLITVALDRVKYEIPEEVLKYVFSPTRYDPSRNGLVRDYSTAINTDTVIRRQVIEARVLTDMNLCSGVEIFVPLNGSVHPEMIDQWTYIYRIPKELTQGRSITVPYGIAYGQGNQIGAVGLIAADRSAVLESTDAMVQSNMPWTQVQTAYVTLVADNVVQVTNLSRVPGMAYLRCLVAHDPNLSNIPPFYADKFTELVILAVKAYIYTKSIIQLDEGAIRGGASLGRIREIIDSYADANQMYKEYLRDQWRKAGLQSNTEQHRRLMRYTVGSRR